MHLLQQLLGQTEEDLGLLDFALSKARNREELIEGIKEAANHDHRLVIEQAVNARELECAVIGKLDLTTSAVGEICFNSDWYDYETKYSQNSSKAIIPAPISDKTRERVKELTLKACKAIAANGMARVDFFYKEETEES